MQINNKLVLHHTRRYAITKDENKFIIWLKHGYDYVKIGECFGKEYRDVWEILNDLERKANNTNEDQIPEPI